MVYRRTRAEMPAHHVEADDTEKEGVAFVFQAAPIEVLGDRRGLRCRTALHEDGARSAGRIGSAAAGAGAGQRLRPRLRRGHHGHRHGARYGGLRQARSSTTGRGLDRGGRADAADQRALALRRRRRRLWSVGHHARHRSGSASGLHDRPLDPGSNARGLRPAPARGRQERGAGAPAGLPSRRGPAAPSEVISAAPSDFSEVELPMTEAEARDGAGLCLDCGVCSECGECVDGLPRRGLHRPARPGPDQPGRGRGRGRGHRLQALRRGPQATVRLRHLQERHHRHADGPPARSDPSLQHHPASRATARCPSVSRT